MMQTFGRTIVYIILLTFLVTWGNQLCQTVSDFVKNQLGVDPSNVSRQYTAMLIPKKAQAGQHGLLEWIFSGNGIFMEMLIAGILSILGIVAAAIAFLANIFQHFILYLGYSLSPIFIGFLAFGSLRKTGFNYLLNLFGVMLWPLGWAVAAIVTNGLLSFMTDQSFLNAGAGGIFNLPGVQQASGAVGYGLQNLLGLALLGIWLIFSTIAIPVIIHKALASGALMGGELLSGARTASGNAAASGMATRGAMLISGWPGWGAGIAGTAAAAGSFASSASGASPSPIMPALTHAAVGEEMERRYHAKQPAFEKGDITGDKGVNNLLDQTRNPYDAGNARN
jgi:hypothetical protein